MIKKPRYIINLIIINLVILYIFFLKIEDYIFIIYIHFFSSTLIYSYKKKG